MQDVVVAIQFLNEPFLAKLDREMVKQFYRDAFYNLREISDTPAMLHDGFQNPSWMDGFLTPQDNNAQNVIVDRHEYQIFDNALAGMSVDQHLSLTCGTVGFFKLAQTRALTNFAHRRVATQHLTSGALSVNSPVPSLTALPT